MSSRPSPVPPIPPRDEPWRPRFHYSPARHWLNDPNGLVFVDGEYHLFYQHNPLGITWGHMSWGHAVSRDLLHWQELPVAIPHLPQDFVFSGSAVVDTQDTAGFAAPNAVTALTAAIAAPATGSTTAPNPGSATGATSSTRAVHAPLVAIYTGFDPATRIQSQRLAYSLDQGRSFTRYAGNPVLDIGDTEFRDPRVIWHAASGRWVMLLAKALEQQVWFYTSTDLKAWTRVSTFGPAGSARNNIWECPDLFELPVDGDPARRRWVLVVSVNHGSLWGGSGVQYFVGDFDGARFQADPAGTLDGLAVPPGDLVADFESADGSVNYPPGWTGTGTAFGTGPVTQAPPGQRVQSGFLGRRLVVSASGGGTLSSSPFSITRDHLAFLVAGASGGSQRIELRVGDAVVRSVGGQTEGALRWTSWDVAALRGQQAVLRIVDEAPGGGAISIDHIVQTDQAQSEPDRSRVTLWADHGRDFYAPQSFGHLSDGRVVWIGWMNNWDYAASVPTQPWCGQFSLPRELGLVSTPQGPRLRQQPAREALALLAASALFEARGQPAAEVCAGLRAAAVAGACLRLRLRVARAGLLAPVGLALLAGGPEAVRVGYDPAGDLFFVERLAQQRRFDGDGERHWARRVRSDATDEIEIEVWLDACLLELFADDGRVTISDLVFNDPAHTGVALFAGPENPLIREFEVRLVAASMG